MEISEQDQQKIEELVLGCIGDGISLGTVKGFTVDEIEAVYNVAYNLYQQRQYEKAEQLFLFLTFHEHMDGRFSFGLGGCYQAAGKHSHAINAYSSAALFDATNPLPAFHACECYIALKDWDNARKAIVAVETICKTVADEADHSKLLEKVAIISKTIKDREANAS